MPDTSLLFFRYAVPHPDSEFAFDDKRLGVWNKRDGSVVDLLTSDPRIPMQIESVMRDPVRWFQIACEAVGKPRYSFALDRITPLLPFTTPLDVGIAGAQGHPVVSTFESLRSASTQGIGAVHTGTLRRHLDTLNGWRCWFYSTRCGAGVPQH